MTEYVIRLHPAAMKELLDLPPKTKDRFEAAIDRLALDPFRPRVGCDVTKLADLDEGATLLRLRVGQHRACYAVLSREREILILLFEDREVGYRRMIATAVRRFGRRL